MFVDSRNKGLALCQAMHLPADHRK